MTMSHVIWFYICECACVLFILVVILNCLCVLMSFTHLHYIFGSQEIWKQSLSSVYFDNFWIEICSAFFTAHTVLCVFIVIYNVNMNLRIKIVDRISYL